METSLTNFLKRRSISPVRKHSLDLQDPLSIPLISIAPNNDTKRFAVDSAAFESPSQTVQKSVKPPELYTQYYGYRNGESIDYDDIDFDESLTRLVGGQTPVVSYFGKRGSKHDDSLVKIDSEDGTFAGDSLPESEFLNLILHQNNLDDVLEMVRQRLDFIRENDDAAKMNRMPFWILASFRLPAIILTILFELCVGVIIAQFTNTMSKHLLLASFTPVLSAISGNIGLQASAATLRALATGHASQSQFLDVIKVLVKEFASAMTIAVLAGITLFVIGSSWAASTTFGLVTGVSVCISASMAGTIGSLAPLFFKSFGIDPAVTAGPFETALQDMIGISIYLFIASKFL
ncbi:hypothetical protein HK096_001677 [Nowakowskiella sp. JEL0078]|nr:hypothetical protein HK096_001677 [Nowakowskiella sp. JEL0078]